MKKQTIVSILTSFMSSFAFLMLTIFLFKSFGWNVLFEDALSVVKVGFVYGVFSVATLFILNFYLAFRLKETMNNVESLDVKNMLRFLAIKLGLDLLLSSLAIWLSLFIFKNELIIKGFFAYFGIMMLTYILKGIFQLTTSYMQNKDKIGGQM